MCDRRCKAVVAAQTCVIVVVVCGAVMHECGAVMRVCGASVLRVSLWVVWACACAHGAVDVACMRRDFLCKEG